MPTTRRQKSISEAPPATALAQQSSASKEAQVEVITAPPAPAQARRGSKLPKIAQFPLLVVLNLAISALLYSAGSGYGGKELARISRKQEGWEIVGGLVGWRVSELALGWFGGYDSTDLAALSLLSKGPPLYLLHAFYNIPSLTLLLSLSIDTLTTYLPFRLLRPLSTIHSSLPKAPNKDILTDKSIQTITTLLSASIYSTTLYAAFTTYLPWYLATYFEGIPSIERVYSATPASLFPLALGMGYAARGFIFLPAVAQEATEEDRKWAAFDPQTATLFETLWYNLWGFTEKTKVVIRRTAALALISGINTFVQTFGTIEGVEAKGAIAYSGLWVVAAAFSGIALGAAGAV